MKRFFAFAAVAVTALAIASCAGDSKEKKAAEAAEEPKVEAPAEAAPATPEITEEVKKTQSEGLTLQGPKASGLQMEEKAPSKVNPELIKGVKGKK